MMTKCFMCGCEETTTWDEDRRGPKGSGHVDRHFVCTNCGMPYAHALIRPYNGNWEDIEDELDFTPFTPKTRSSIGCE